MQTARMSCSQHHGPLIPVRTGTGLAVCALALAYAIRGHGRPTRSMSFWFLNNITNLPTYLPKISIHTIVHKEADSLYACGTMPLNSTATNTV